jgi:hypothetical protein
MRARIRSGALAGQEGTVVGRRGEQRLLISLQSTLTGISVEIDKQAVELFDEHAN